jgi:predicted RNA-binding protein with RPS1 domain
MELSSIRPSISEMDEQKKMDLILRTRQSRITRKQKKSKKKKKTKVIGADELAESLTAEQLEALIKEMESKR